MQRLVDAGELTEDEAEQSERRNIILQALGPDPRVKVDLTHQPIRRGDTLILCSDGLSGLVRKEEFARLSGHTDRPRCAPRSIDLANARGGPDNITVVAARFEGDGLPEANGSDGVGTGATDPRHRDARRGDGRAGHEISGTKQRHESDPAIDRIRSLALVLIVPGVLLLLLAVWRSLSRNNRPVETAGVDAPLRVRLAWLAALSFASGFPFGLVNETLPVYLRTHGSGLVEIGLISALSFPWTFKFIWSPLVDRVGTRKQWIAACLAGLTVLTLILATVELGTMARWFWLLLALMVTLSATQDIAIDAYTIETTTTKSSAWPTRYGSAPIGSRCLPLEGCCCGWRAGLAGPRHFRSGL